MDDLHAARCRRLGSSAANALSSGRLGRLLLVGLALSSCAVDATTPAPSCEGGGSQLIVAQSVPSAQLIPCLEFIPVGWELASVVVNQTGSEITLDSDRAGTGAAVLRLEPTCDIGEAVPTASEHPGADRFDRVDRLAPGFLGFRFYRFDGGCVTLEFAFDDDASATESVALADALQFVDREALNDQLRRSFVDEEL